MSSDSRRIRATPAAPVLVQQAEDAGVDGGGEVVGPDHVKMLVFRLDVFTI